MNLQSWTKSLGHLCNVPVTNYLCFRTEAWKNAALSFKNVLLSPLPNQHNVANQVNLQVPVLVFNIVWGMGAEVKQEKLYLRLACAQKRQKCKFVPKLLSMIVWISVEK